MSSEAGGGVMGEGIDRIFEHPHATIVTTTVLSTKLSQMPLSPSSDESSPISSCQQVVTAWYQLWTRWIRGLSERTLLIEEWKHTTVDIIESEATNIDNDDTTTYNNNNKRCIDRETTHNPNSAHPPFIWIDIEGRTWKNLDFLHGEEDGPTRTDDNEENRTKETDHSSSLLVYGTGATWGGVEVSIDDWQIYSLDSYSPQQGGQGSSPAYLKYDDDNKATIASTPTYPPQIRYFRVTCRVKQTITPALRIAGATKTTVDGATKTRTTHRRISAIVQQHQQGQKQDVRESISSGDNGGSSERKAATVFSSRLVQLHESLIPDDENDSPDVPEDPRDGEQRQGQNDEFKSLKSSMLKANDDNKTGPPIHHHSHDHSSSGGNSSRRICSSNVPSTRRFIAAQSVLDKYGARPLLEKTKSPDGITNVQSLVGLSLQGWDIATSQGPIGDQHWFEHALRELEPLAQPRVDVDTVTDASKGRKLVLPEMVFPLAHVVLEHSIDYNNTNNHDHSDTCCHSDNHEVFVSWDAMEALKEWSHAHRAIPMPNINDSIHDKNTSTRTDSTVASPPTKMPSSPSFRGVSVLQSSDADLWNKKQRQHRNNSSKGGGDDAKNKNNSGTDVDETLSNIRNSEFHYDWTYSTPFAGRIFLTSTLRWEPLSQSGMPMYLLTDTSVPILYYDHIVVLEDDLHDNGAIEYTVKVRIMPHCVYVLARLFVRVDHVLVRVRDARWLVDFGIASSGGSGSKKTRKIIYRDITWREAAWKDLGSKYQLPTQVQAWTTTSSTAETPAFQMLLSKLPMVEKERMPTDIIVHAQLCYSE